MDSDIIPICRVCLKTSLEYIDLESSYDTDEIQIEDCAEANDINEYTKHSKKLTYMDCFKECTHLNVEVCDTVSPSICVPCGLDLRIAYEFLKKAENAAQFFQRSVKQNSNKLQEIQMLNDDELSDSKNEGYVIVNFEEGNIEEVYELSDVLSEPGKEYIQDNESDEVNIPTSENEIIEDNLDYDIFELNNITSDADNIQSDTGKIFEVLVISNNNVDNIDQSKDCANVQDKISSSFSKEITSHAIDNASKRISKANKVYRNRSKKKANSWESLNSCKICYKHLDDLTMTDHIEKHHMHIEKCQHCGYQDNEFKVREHEKIKHANKNNYLCYVCSKTFFTLGILNAHLKYHERKNSNFKSDACKICGKKFSTQHYLRRHLEVHKNERNLHKCEQCDKLYITKYALDNHMKLHKGETIKCLECDKQFSRQYELNVHMRFHTREYPFSCEVCGKKFAIKGHLRSHMWRHQGLKLQCEDCGKLFTSSKALLEHSYTHTEMPFPCCYCPKAYPSRQKFKVHLKTAHSIQLNEEELQKVTGSIAKKPLLRKKLTLVQADSVIKEIEVKTKDEADVDDVEDLVVELC